MRLVLALPHLHTAVECRVAAWDSEPLGIFHSVLFSSS